ncbi:hypothetical protein SAMN06297358_0484 [Pedobacter xixiisoli]|uniref:Uncharacterized protein n=1 Tax=Pedobacter xixiisoli TaxID=1476464 RepID=A0A285ZR30_9SPHI|nr:hypothetical protein SAMN06297358_0484 [Pedobacter xixiisoli]
MVIFFNQKTIFIITFTITIEINSYFNEKNNEKVTTLFLNLNPMRITKNLTL